MVFNTEKISNDLRDFGATIAAELDSATGKYVEAFVFISLPAVFVYSLSL